MGYMNIFVNEILHFPKTNETFRILWIDEGNVIAYLIDLHDEKAVPFVMNVSDLKEEIPLDEIQKIKDDPFVHLLFHSEITDKQKEYRDNAWNVIKDIVTNEPDIFVKSVQN
ncbi:hypothetical protein KHA80_09290 [Anaerobacillus sp. HL2]|nr:hypothetical protein KHA80_09290 [Anaerobacillus sp. HL2]